MDDSCYSYKQDKHFTCKRSILECCRGKAVSITYSEFVRVALLIQHAMLRHLITRIFSFVVCMAIQYFIPHYLINGTIFGKNFVEHRLRVLITSAIFIWNISHSKKNWARYDQKYIIVFMWSTRYTFLILIKLEFLDIFSKNTQISSLMKICPVGAELFQADEQMNGHSDRHEEASSRFSQYSKSA